MSGNFRNKRFIAAAAAAVLLLCAAVWVNLKLSRDDSLEHDAIAAEPAGEEGRETMLTVYNDYFNTFRAERSEVRAKEIEYLRSMINSGDNDAETMKDVEERLVRLVGSMEKEFTIESRIRGKGFLDAAVTVCPDAATVIIDGESLTDEEVARILDIVISETGLPASAIKISLGG